MSRLHELFKHKSSRILNVYCTAGFPQADSTLPVMKALQDAGADIIELGMPYSDPLADGPVIQHSSGIALQNGMTIAKLFADLKEFRRDISIPVILMGYLNPVLQYGFERFCRDAEAAGVDGLILPDLPEYEYETIYGPMMKAHGLDMIFLVTPETSEERVRRLDELSSGFLYAVSSSSTTGSGKKMDSVEEYLMRLKGYGLQNPVLVGFGIRDRETFDTACRHANGAIIGTAYIQQLKHSDEVEMATRDFLGSILT
ncbi:MAG: tryptophan synthase subunit alpha [Chitinophagaceae bacterium]